MYSNTVYAHQMTNLISLLLVAVHEERRSNSDFLTLLLVIFSALDLVHSIVMPYRKSSGNRISSRAVPMNADVMT